MLHKICAVLLVAALVLAACASVQAPDVVVLTPGTGATFYYTSSNSNEPDIQVSVLLEEVSTVDNVPVAVLSDGTELKVGEAYAYSGGTVFSVLGIEGNQVTIQLQSERWEANGDYDN